MRLTLPDRWECCKVGYGSHDVSTFSSVKPLDIFQETFGKIPAIPCVWQQKNKKIWREVGTSLYGEQNMYFKPN